MQMRKEQIEQLFRQHYPRMYQLALVLLKDEAASKDVVSDVFADVLDGDVELLPDKARSYLFFARISLIFIRTVPLIFMIS